MFTNSANATRGSAAIPNASAYCNHERRAITSVAMKPASTNNAAVGRAAKAMESAKPAPAAAHRGNPGHVNSHNAMVTKAETTDCCHNIWLEIAHIEVLRPHSAGGRGEW